MWSNCLAKHAVGVATTAILLTGPALAEGPPMSARLVQLSVTRELADKDKMPMMMSQTGTLMKFLVHQPGVYILGIEESGCKLNGFADSQKTDLSGSKRRFGSGPAWLGSFPQFNEARDAVLFDIVSDRLPAKGAASIEVDAAIALRVGSKPTTQQVKDVALQKGTKVSLGGVDMTISEAGDQNTWGDVKWNVSFESKSSMDAIQSIRFLDADGKAVGSTAGGSGRWSSGRDTTYSQSHGLHRKLESVTIEVTYFAEVKTVNVPVKFSAGLGLE